MEGFKVVSSKLCSFTFSMLLLASAFLAWIFFLFSNVVMGFEETAAVEIIAALCFLGASTTSFIAGALYGHEAEYERTQREKDAMKDLEQQPLLGAQE
jgi:cation transport ATPase